MTDTDTTITIKLPVQVSKRTYPKGWTARIGPHEHEAVRKPDALTGLREVITRALSCRAAGEVSQVAVVGDHAYVLACDAGGMWYRTILKIGGRAVGATVSADHNEAAGHFAQLVADAHAAHESGVAREAARPLRDEAARMLHVARATGRTDLPVGMSDADAAEKVAADVANMRRELEVYAAAARVGASTPGGMSPEAAALARLLGLHGDDVATRTTAASAAVLASTRASRWSGTFADLAAIVGGSDPLDTLARAHAALDDAEQRVMDIGGPADDGPIAKWYESETRSIRRGGENDGIAAAESAWQKHVAEIRKAYDALDDMLAGLDTGDMPEAVVARLDELRADATRAFDADAPEVTVDD